RHVGPIRVRAVHGEHRTRAQRHAGQAAAGRQAVRGPAAGAGPAHRGHRAGGDDPALHLFGDARGIPDRAGAAQGILLRAGLDDGGSGVGHRAALHPLGGDRRRLPWPWPRAGRDDGGDLRARQCLQHHQLAVDARHFDLLRHRQRVQRGGGHAPLGADRAGLPAVRGDLRRAADRAPDAAPAGAAGGPLMALLICAPIGVLAGTFLAEYANRTKLSATIRFLNDILLSAPSIVLGLFVYVIIVLPMSNLTHGNVSFSGFAGAVALALIGLPVIVRTTDEMLQLVPGTLREATLSLGIPQWKMTVQVLMRAATSGIVTGVLLALARLAGETAPLLFTAFGNNFMAVRPLDKMESLPVAIYQYTNDPSPDLHAIAWAGALLITLFVLALSLLTRMLFIRHKVRYD